MGDIAIDNGADTPEEILIQPARDRGQVVMGITGDELHPVMTLLDHLRQRGDRKGAFKSGPLHETNPEVMVSGADTLEPAPVWEFYTNVPATSLKLVQPR